MDLGIKGKRVLITGASQGIGRSVALAFAREGCRVAIVARREAELLKVVAEMGGVKLGHAHYAADLMDLGAPVKVVKTLIAEGGVFDIVVHNVGGAMGVKDVLADSVEWLKVWQFNVGIAIDINKVVVPSMQAKQWGRIIHISSLAAENLRASSAYSAAKAYLNAYAKVIGGAVARDGIVVSALMPGAICDSGGHWDEEAVVNQENIEEFKRKKADYLQHYQPIDRFGKAREIASFVLFMASEQASFAAGSVIPVSGGGV